MISQGGRGGKIARERRDIMGSQTFDYWSVSLSILDVYLFYLICNYHRPGISEYPFPELINHLRVCFRNANRVTYHQPGTVEGTELSRAVSHVGVERRY